MQELNMKELEQVSGGSFWSWVKKHKAIVVVGAVLTSGVHP